MEYVLADRKYALSYQQLKDEYERFCSMNDSDFVFNAAAAAHLACFICFIKEIPSEQCLSDIGIIHQLIHLVHIQKDTLPELNEIRNLFKSQLLLT